MTPYHPESTPFEVVLFWCALTVLVIGSAVALWAVYCSLRKGKSVAKGAVQRLPILALVLYAAHVACISYPSPAFVLQREASGYKAALRQSRARSLSVDDLHRIEGCDRYVRLTDDAAHESYPVVSAEAKALAGLMRQSCAGIEGWGKPAPPPAAVPVAPVVDMGVPLDPGHPDLSHPAVDEPMHVADGGASCGSDC